MPTTTPNLGLYLPLVNDVTDQDLWGGYLNENSDTLDTDVHTLQVSVAAIGTIPVGSIFPYAGVTAPTNYLLCYGQAISRTTYSVLFGIIGTTYGAGDTTTTFNLPDLRGRTAFGKDDMGGSAASRITNDVSGITATTLGATGGNQHYHQHTHIITDPGHNHSFPPIGVNGSVFALVDVNSGGSTNPNPQTGTTTTGITINNSGTGLSENIPPAIIINYIIKAV